MFWTLPVWILLLPSFFLSIVVSNQNLSTARTVYGLSGPQKLQLEQEGVKNMITHTRVAYLVVSAQVVAVGSLNS